MGKLQAFHPPQKARWLPATLIALLAFAAIVLAVASIITAPWREEHFLQKASLEALIAAAQEQPDDERVLYFLGKKAAQAGQIQIAETAFTHAVVLTPNDEAAWLEWAKLLDGQGQPLKAAALIKLYLRHHSKSALAHLQLGLLQQELRADPNAYDEAMQAAALTPHDPRPWRLAGEEALKLHRDQEAEHSLRQAIVLMPGDWLSDVRLGYVLSDEGRSLEAEAVCRQATAQAPQEAMPALALGTILFLQARTMPEIEEARRNFEWATERDPTMPQAYLYLGRCDSHEAKWAAAKLALERARQLDPQNPEVHYELSRVLSRLGDHAGAAHESGLHQILKEYDNRKQELLARFYDAHDLAAGDALVRLLRRHGDSAAAAAIDRSLFEGRTHGRL